jgi:carbon-monoxide dehydrogenase medium subunit
VYPSRFAYEAPRTLEEAIDLLTRGQGEAKILAGGQSLIPMLKLRFANPEMLVDINNLPGLSHHTLGADGSLRVGALCRHGQLERFRELHAAFPTLAAAAPLVADPIVRNRGTLVGSICHADPQGDWAAVAIATGASVVAQGPRGKRTIPVAEFVTGPFTHVLDHDEVAVEVVFPAPKGTPAGGYLKLERRVGDFATAGVGVALERSGASVTRAGMALTGVGGQTVNAQAAADELVGGELTADRIARAAEKAAAAAQPRSDHRGSAAYKRHIVHTFVTRILTRLADDVERAA